MTTIVEKARIFATAAHAAIDQRRKYTNDHYIVHPESVSFIIAAHGGSLEMQAAAWLHDVVEDTKVNLGTIIEIFGHEVGAMVEALTKKSKPEDGNRVTRFVIDTLAIVGSGNEQANAVKLADLLDNTGSITLYDLEFASVYLAEKTVLMALLVNSPLPSLFESTNRCLASGVGKLCGKHLVRYENHRAACVEAFEEAYGEMA